MRVQDECIELTPVSDGQAAELRALIGQVNGPCSAQPFLQEDPPGRFRLFVGDAAGRMRTARGIS